MPLRGRRKTQLGAAQMFQDEISGNPGEAKVFKGETPDPLEEV